MCGWLVLARCNIDDVPMGLFPTEAEARAHAMRLSVRSVLAVADDVMGLDVSAVLTLNLVQIEHGLPVGLKPVDEWPHGE